MKKALLIVVMAIVTSAAFAADNNLEVPYNLEGDTIEIDGNARPVHVQAVVANLRQRTSEVAAVSDAAAEGASQALDTSQQALEQAQAAREAAESASTPWWVYAALLILAAGLAYLWTRVQDNQETAAEANWRAGRAAWHSVVVADAIGITVDSEAEVTEEESAKVASLFATPELDELLEDEDSDAIEDEEDTEKSDDEGEEAA